MSESSLDLINEYKDQIRILKQQIAELEDAGKSKDAANKRCLQKLEFSNKDLEDSQSKVKELEKKLREEKKTSKMMLEHP
jgi:chromosome segregation ATPase